MIPSFQGAWSQRPSGRPHAQPQEAEPGPRQRLLTGSPSRAAFAWGRCPRGQLQGRGMLLGTPEVRP